MSNFAYKLYVSPLPLIPAFATFNASIIIAANPNVTKKPTNISVFLEFISLTLYAPNIIAVSTKSNPNTAKEDCTTVSVVALLIPSDVGTQS